MNRIPPSLLYLTIYNPSLRPRGPIPEDDEDAEEQAHILFYTSQERAVSRDRMLRQVGLAKALVNFSEMFNANDPCNSVHSQSKRMIMVSPEPDFWIHAGIEVAKVLRTTPDKGKGKGKEKTRIPEKGKGKETTTEPVYDFLEGSVLDIALKQDILRGYDQFKLTHGSFTYILSTIGQQALELQLERFFTVWAWTWNLEDGHDLKEHLGNSLHPRFRSLTPILDKYAPDLPSGSTSVVLSPPYVIPSSSYTNMQYPTLLARHLFSLIPRNHTPTSNSADVSDGTIKAKSTPGLDNPGGQEPLTAQEPPSSTFLGIPAVSVGVEMDVRKWNWPGYLTFGRGSNRRSGPEDKGKLSTSVDQPGPEDSRTTVANVDTSALEDAMSSDNKSVLSSAISNGSQAESRESGDISGSTSPTGDESEFPKQLQSPVNVDLASLTPTTSPLEEISRPYSVRFASTTVHLSDPETPLLTLRQKVYYILHAHIMLALIGVNDEADPENPEPLALRDTGTVAMKLLEEIEDTLNNDVTKSTDTLPSATKILQPTDSHIVSRANFTVSSPAFASKSGHLYNAREIQAIDPEILEVFSRGQNPQHWHIARRGLGYKEDGTLIDGEVFLEVFRKEASLSDVDNVLAGVVRKCELTEG
ncbi:hypothetical protein BDZ94DRAFT_1265778 [Collybia nuda]|uniref:CCZ1/INTU/HSP4 first Longin domain-containing protein n=1 Tax=Collybia nuda TaxID=64659 RepID=A0A9P5Y3I2_9AGAR|nr:hypothetical protein BDZ94DRAFT_1265778 [Collybia nuda]